MNQGVSLRAQKDKGPMAIEYDVRCCHEKLVALLLERYKHLDIQEKTEIDSAYYFADERGHPACIDMLSAASSIRGNYYPEPQPTREGPERN